MQQLQQALPSHTYALLRIVVITQHAVQCTAACASEAKLQAAGPSTGAIAFKAIVCCWKVVYLRDQCFGMLCRLSVGHVSRGHYTDQAWKASRWWWLLGGSVRPVRLSGVVENVAVDLKKKRG